MWTCILIMQNLLPHQLGHRLPVPEAAIWHDPWPLLSPREALQRLGPPQAKRLHGGPSNSSYKEGTPHSQHAANNLTVGCVHASKWHNYDDRNMTLNEISPILRGEKKCEFLICFPLKPLIRLKHTAEVRLHGSYYVTDCHTDSHMTLLMFLSFDSHS